MERRLAAILAADVVGYSRLIREDEAGTLAALKTLREQLIEPKVAERNDVGPEQLSVPSLSRASSHSCADITDARPFYGGA